MPNKSNDYIRLDVNSGRLVKQIYVRQNDTVARTICATIVNNGKPVSLEGASSVAIRIERPDGTQAFNSCVVVGNEIQYTLRTTDISVIGTSTAQFEITYLSSENFSTPVFNIQVFKKNVDDATMRSMNEYTAMLDGAAAAQSAAIDATAQAVVAAQQATEAATSATSAKAQADIVESYYDTYTELKEAAEESAENAKESEDNAKVSEDNASSSAVSASASATLASTYALNAKTSEDNTKESEDNAKLSENNALASATSASVESTNAKAYADEAKGYSDLAKGYKDDSKSYADQAKEISESLGGTLIPMGTKTFEELIELENVQAGYMYNISDEFTTTDAFKEGSGHVIPLGSNVFMTADGKWDVLAGSPVTGIKGIAEDSYRRGNVNIKASDLGLEHVAEWGIYSYLTGKPSFVTSNSEEDDVVITIDETYSQGTKSKTFDGITENVMYSTPNYFFKANLKEGLLADVAKSGNYSDLKNKPFIPREYTLPAATEDKLGGVKPDGTTITVDSDGTIHSEGGDLPSFTEFATGYDTLAYGKGSVAEGGYSTSTSFTACTVDSISIANDTATIGITFASATSLSMAFVCAYTRASNRYKAIWYRAKSAKLSDGTTDLTKSGTSFILELVLQTDEQKSDIALISVGDKIYRGYAGNSAIGTNAHAEGYSTVASGQYSHAEGNNNIVSGECSHAEGIANLVNGYYAHIEGSTNTANGNSSHAEGKNNTARGNFSHAQNHQNIASGLYSHAEGNNNSASGESSHAQNYYTIAAGAYQTALGQYNIEDTTSAVIVGNGDSSSRSNALTLDWNGNLNIAGKLNAAGGIEGATGEVQDVPIYRVTLNPTTTNATTYAITIDNFKAPCMLIVDVSDDASVNYAYLDNTAPFSINGSKCYGCSPGSGATQNGTNRNTYINKKNYGGSVYYKQRMYLISESTYSTSYPYQAMDMTPYYADTNTNSYPSNYVYNDTTSAFNTYSLTSTKSFQTSTTDLTAGTSTLSNGQFYIVYE